MEVQYFDKFEYTVEYFSGYSISKIVSKLNELGQEGWELISINKENNGKVYYLFKRKLNYKNV